MRQELALQYRPHGPDKVRADRRVRGLHPQEAFHQDRYRVRYRAALAGTGGGKTHASAFEAISWAVENPGSVGLLFEPDFKMVKRTMIPALEEHLGPLNASRLVTWHATASRLDYPNGSRQWLIGLQDGDKTEGINADYAWVDEARLVPKWRQTWLSIKRRLRGSRPGMRTGAFISTHSPTKDIVDEWEGPTANRAEYRVYRWATGDNPSLTREYIEEIERSHSGAAFKLVVLGEHARPEGLVYSEFDPKRHITPARPVGEYDRFTYGIDWGWTMPSAILAIGWRGSRAHIVDEYYRSYATPEELRLALREMQARWRRGRAYCDASRPENIDALTRGGLEAEAYKGKVADGVAIVNGMYRGGELLVDPRCVNVARELDLYSYPPGKEGDEPEKGNDHSMDAKRYGILGGRQPTRRLLVG